MTKGGSVDERSFDNLVRDFTASVWSRRTLAWAAVALGASAVAPLDGGTDAARRRQARRKKSGKAGKGKRGNSGKGSGDSGDCGSTDSCPRDPETGKPGFVCADGLCSCGGTCCEKGFACFIGAEPVEEVCCFDDAAAVEIPKDVEFAVCPGAPEPRDTCCKSNECDQGMCQTFTPGRYRRTPR